MNVEVVAVGTELLLGQIINRNAATIGEALAEAGIDSYRHTTVGDNLDRLAAVLSEALTRADAVVMTGGIGPTPDDLTREAICEALGVDMVFSDSYAERLRDWWKSRGRDMPESNLKQAQHPDGARLLINDKGTAPGLEIEHDGKVIFALPGVPAEMYDLLHDHVIPSLRKRTGEDSALVIRILRTWGQSESLLAESLNDIYESTSNPMMAFLASSAEIKVRLTAKAATVDEAEQLIAPVEAAVRERLGSLIFGTDDETVENLVLSAARSRGWKLATAESATGGLIASRLTSVPGASDVVLGGVVAYATAMKAKLLGVPIEILDDGVVSEDTAIAMAEGACRELGADAAIAVTGSAGPTPQEKDVGTMVFGFATPEGVGARTLKMPGDRERVRTYATTAALHFLRLALQGEGIA
ncbi:MAG: competence/damage-inducible protein A [Acidimicrobiia bacterium]|nr:competence/damage-inducible protein A [Acidimicrobiia bacterium]